MFASIRSLIWLVVLVVGVAAAATWLPAWLNRVQVPADFDDMKGFESMSGVWLEPPPYRVGDMVAYRWGERSDDVSFGVIAATSGDQIRIAEGRLLVNGREASGWPTSTTFPPVASIGPLTIPRGHVYVLNTRHGRDSVVLGTIAPDQLLGRVAP